MFLLFALLALPSASAASTCSEMSLARVEAARLLIQDVESTTDIDKSSVAERAIILLDRTLKAEPSCADAKTLKRQAEKLVKKTTPLSVAADFEAAVVNLGERVSTLESASARDPQELETLGFMAADLINRFPNDQRLSTLARRVAALRGER